jgi:hypothetical protein
MTALILKPKTLAVAPPHQRTMWWHLAFASVLLLTMFCAGAATDDGIALQEAFDTLDEMVNGFGKQILTLVGFALAAIMFMNVNAAGVIMKFVGFGIFLGAGYGAIVTMAGALV